ncbi:uncharacterized protein RJT21DRAFT_31630 [Scheffersomyces amazonensis]|uniref:uncharacterized protein n=1 Tax=Scheffersomyces amazonensis TaxID=1078765 RepID=UPI00315D9E14
MSALPQISQDVTMLKRKQDASPSTSGDATKISNTTTPTISNNNNNNINNNNVTSMQNSKSPSPGLKTSSSSSPTHKVSTPLLKKESLTATKLTNIFANSNAQAATTLNRHHIKPKSSGQSPIAIKPSPKYTKIQPAIAPKPMQPKSNGFSPVPNQSNTSLDSTLNTSKRWVLPPRPRPGRKPTTTSSSNSNVGHDHNNASATTKRKSKLPKKEVGPLPDQVPINSPTPVPVVVKTEPKSEATPLSASSTISAVSNVASSTPSTSPESNSIPITTPTAPVTTSKSNPLSSSQTPIPNISNQPSSAKVTPLVQPLTKSTTSIKLESDQANSNILPNPTIAPSVVNRTHTVVDPKTEIIDLKMCYLSKLKEQEVIRNYIEVITNQIKELSFVQNGVITFDALKNNVNPIHNPLKLKRMQSTSSTSTPSVMNVTNNGSMGNGSTGTTSLTGTGTGASIGNIDSINNLNDLNKALNYLTKSSSIIHSATKQQHQQQSNNGALSNLNSEAALNNQISHYLSIRDKFKTMKTEELKKLNSLKRQNNKRRVAKQQQQDELQGQNSSDQGGFTPDLLKPLKSINLFDPDTNDDVDMMIDILNSTSNNASGVGVGVVNNDITGNDDTKINDGQSSVSAILMSNELISNDDDIDLIMEEPDFLSRLMLNDTSVGSTPTSNGSSNNTNANDNINISNSNINVNNNNNNNTNNNSTNNNSDLVLKEQEKLGNVTIHAQIANLNGRGSMNNNNNNNNSNSNNNTSTTNGKGITNDALIKKKLKLNCGFCTNDTPCLCFDTDFDLR